MISFKIIFTFLLFGVVTFGKSPCDIPKRFQSSIQFVTNDLPECRTTTSFGTIYFDYPGRRLREDFYGSNLDQSFATYWAFYSKEKAYYYDHKTSKCYALSLNSEMDDPIIPAESTFQGTSLIGSQAIDSWEVTADNATLIVSVTSDNCFPVTSTSTNTTTGDLIFSENFSNFIPQIPPFIFDFPKECDNAIVQKKHIGNHRYRSRHVPKF